MAAKIITGKELAEAALNAANNYKTLYVSGCFGAPMNPANKERYSKGASASRAAKINAADPDTFGFDCVCLIKGLLWGWCGDASKTYGGAVYASNGVHDIGEDAMIAECADISTDFSPDKIQAGEAVWLPGHIGVYVGDGLAVECTSKWSDGVQVTACNCDRSGYNRRDWTKHGKLPYVTYAGTSNPEPAPGAAAQEPEAKTDQETECDDMVYFKTLDDVPEFYRPAVKKLVAAGALQGTGGGELNVSDDFCRIMTVLDRMGKLD